MNHPQTDWLQAAVKRHVPFLDYLNIRPISAGNGRSEFQLTTEEVHLRTFGILHGGVTASLLDTAVGFAAVTVAPPGHHVVTVQLNMNFTKTVEAGETLRANGAVQHAGQRTAVVQGEVRNAEDDLVAVATATMMYLPLPAGAQALLQMEGDPEDE
ncbi:MAG: PaaI family thioesterase [Planctomycetaceae bacterium]